MNPGLRCRLLGKNYISKAFLIHELPCKEAYNIEHCEVVTKTLQSETYLGSKRLIPSVGYISKFFN